MHVFVYVCVYVYAAHAGPVKNKERKKKYAYVCVCAFVCVYDAHAGRTIFPFDYWLLQDEGGDTQDGNLSEQVFALRSRKEELDDEVLPPSLSGS